MKKTADKVKAKAKQAADLAKQAYALAKDPAMREQAFAEAKRRAAAIEQQADKALGDGSKAFRDAADGANQLYSGLADQLTAVGPGIIEEMVRQQILPSETDPARHRRQARHGRGCVAAGRGRHPGSGGERSRASGQRGQGARHAAAPSSPAVAPCSIPTPALPSVKQAQIEEVVDAVVKQVAEHPLLQEHMQKVRDLKPVAEKMLASGMDEAAVAEIISWRRRELGEIYKDLTPSRCNPTFAR